MLSTKKVSNFFKEVVTAKKGEIWEPKEKAPLPELIRRIVAITIILSILLWVLYFKTKEHYTFNWTILFSFKQAYWTAFLMTMKLSVVTLFTSIIFGGIVGLASVSRRVFLRDLAFVYVEGIRNVPLLVIVLLVYFGMGTLLHLPSFAAAVIALTAFEATFFAEIIRGGSSPFQKGR